MQGESRKQFLLKQLKQLETARRPYESQWRELCDFILPNCGRFPGDPPNQVKRNSKILDPTGGLASRTLESGMLTGITSPTRPWFALSTLDKNLMSRWTVKVWLKQVQERMNEVLNRSNFYQTVPVLYRYLGTIGTSAILILEDEESVIRTHVLPVGSYYVANSERLKIDTVFRRLSMTCRQMVGRFGLDAVSDNVKSAWTSGNYEQWFEVMHAVMPNVDRDSGKLNAKNKRYRSVYFETTGDDSLLSESGFDEMPILVPRWDINGEDAYGSSCPGMLALGSIKALQVQQKSKDQAVAKIVNPPMLAPYSMRTERISLLPGEVTYINNTESVEGVRPAYQINLRLNELIESVHDTRELTRECYFVPLFNMFSMINTRSMPIEAVAEMRDEKMLQLGSVLERLNDEFLDPAIDRIFNIMLRRNLFPLPPPELQGEPLRVEYTSVMAQAQKAMGIGAVDRFIALVANVARIRPEALDRLDSDNAISEYATMLGVPPTITVADQQVQAIREQRAQQQQAAQAMQVGAAGADIAKSLSQTAIDENNVLGALTGGQKA